jgi:hypothetical protein
LFGVSIPAAKVLVGTVHADVIGEIQVDALRHIEIDIHLRWGHV